MVSRSQGYRRRNGTRRLQKRLNSSKSPSNSIRNLPISRWSTAARVALGRSIVRDPTVFLFDEPMSDLDAKLKRELRPIIQQVTDQIDCPVLYVTHDQEEAMTMSDRVAVINEGQIEQISHQRKSITSQQPNLSRTLSVSQLCSSLTDMFHEIMDQRFSRLEHIPLTPCRRISSKATVTRLSELVWPQHIRVNGSQNDGISATHILDEPLGDQTNSFFETEFGEVVVVTHPDLRGKVRSTVFRSPLKIYCCSIRLSFG